MKLKLKAIPVWVGGQRAGYLFVKNFLDYYQFFDEKGVESTLVAPVHLHPEFAFRLGKIFLKKEGKENG